jgi:hypothetical protein
MITVVLSMINTTTQHQPSTSITPTHHQPSISTTAATIPTSNNSANNNNNNSNNISSAIRKSCIFHAKGYFPSKCTQEKKKKKNSPTLSSSRIAWRYKKNQR